MVLGLIIVGIVLLVLVVVALFRVMSSTGRSKHEEDRMLRIQEVIRTQAHEGRKEHQVHADALRTEIRESIKQIDSFVGGRLDQISTLQQGKLDHFSMQLKNNTELLNKQQDALRKTLDDKLTNLQQGNEQKLDAMRAMVEEKLQGTLEKGLDQSFKQISERLEQLRESLGEMKTLETGISTLNRVLTNVKTRGTWGEIQLAALLENILPNNQYETNVKVNPERDHRVEFAICLPGKKDDDKPVYLPIDAKFPKEDYERLIDASESGNGDAIVKAGKALENQIKKSAKDIHSKYIATPYTTNFAVMYLPTEGLFAEVIRRPGLSDVIQREYNVTIAGPTTFSALLNSLQMGFRTLAIEKNSSKVWDILDKVKTEIGKFSESLDAVKNNLATASRNMDKVYTRTRVLDKNLKQVEEHSMQESLISRSPSDDINHLAMTNDTE